MQIFNFKHFPFICNGCLNKPSKLNTTPDIDSKLDHIKSQLIDINTIFSKKIKLDNEINNISSAKSVNYQFSHKK